MEVGLEACYEDAVCVELFDVSYCAWVTDYVCAVKG